MYKVSNTQVTMKDPRESPEKMMTEEDHRSEYNAVGNGALSNDLRGQNKGIGRFVYKPS